MVLLVHSNAVWSQQSHCYRSTRLTCIFHSRVLCEGLGGWCGRKGSRCPKSCRSYLRGPAWAVPGRRSADRGSARARRLCGSGGLERRRRLGRVRRRAGQDDRGLLPLPGPLPGLGPQAGRSPVQPGRNGGVEPGQALPRGTLWPRRRCGGHAVPHARQQPGVPSRAVCSEANRIGRRERHGYLRRARPRCGPAARRRAARGRADSDAPALLPPDRHRGRNRRDLH